MAEIVTIDSSEIKLNTNLDEYSFGKTNYESIITQEGVVYDGTDFSSWSFSSVKSFNIEGKTQRIVFYCGENPFSSQAQTLLQMFELAEQNNSRENTAKLYNAVKSVCNALTLAAKTNKNIPLIGAGGIIIDSENAAESDNLKILFLPQDLFVTAANALSQKEFQQLHLGWINQTIYGLPAICFERAVLVYRLLCQKFPYDSSDQVERNADILDSKFLPVQMSVQNLNNELASAVNKALHLNSNSVNIPGKKEKGKKSEDLTPTADFPLHLLQDAYILSQEQRLNPPEKDFLNKAENYERSQAKKIKTKRNIRRNSALIGVIFAVGVILTSLIINSIQTDLDSETSVGLTSTQTVLGFFYGVNTKDTVLLTNLVNGKKPQKHVDTVSQIYVLDKQRHIYEKDNGFATPENWLLFSTTLERYANCGIYGVSNLYIDGEPYEIQITLPKKKDKAEPLTIENDIPLENKMKTTRHAEYFLIHSEGENNHFIVEKVFEDFTLTFHKDRWLITDISTQTVTVPVSSKTFKNDYMNQLALNDADVIVSVENLREKYPWLPTQTALQTEKERLQKELENPLSMFQ